MSADSVDAADANAEVVDKVAERMRVAQCVLEQLDGGTIVSPKDLKQCFVLEPHPSNSLMMIASCKFCEGPGKKFTSTTRLVDHLNLCVLVPPPLKKALQVYGKERQDRKEAKHNESRLQQQEVENMYEERHNEKKRKLLQQTFIHGSMKTAADEVADEAIARWFYAKCEWSILQHCVYGDRFAVP